MPTITTTTTTLTPEEEKRQRDRYRFGGVRYSFRAPDKWGPDNMIPETLSLFAYPRKEE